MKKNCSCKYIWFGVCTGELLVLKFRHYIIRFVYEVGCWKIETLTKLIPRIFFINNVVHIRSHTYETGFEYLASIFKIYEILFRGIVEYGLETPWSFQKNMR